MPFDGDYTQDKYAQQMIDEYKAAGISPADVFPQSFHLRDVLYWLKAEPRVRRSRPSTSTTATTRSRASTR